MTLREEIGFETWREINNAYRSVDPQTKRTFASAIQARTLAQYVRRWRESDDGSFLDVAVQYCQDHDLPVLAALRSLLAELAAKRSPRRKTRAFREHVKSEAYQFMIQLIDADATLKEAAGKAAAYTNDTHRHLIKASTLEKGYTEEYRKTGLEDHIRSEWAEMPDDAAQKALEDQRRVAREPTEMERGNRRD